MAYDEAGKLEGLVRQRTSALQSSEDRLSATLLCIGDGVIIIDRQGTVTSLNRVAETFTGWTTAEATDRLVDEVFCLVGVRTCATADNPVARAFAEGVSVNLSNHTALIARDGKEYQIAGSCAPIRDNSGAITGAVLLFRDVTEDYRRREELREERERLAHVLRITGLRIGVVDAECNLRFVDQASHQVYGEPSGRKCYEYFKNRSEVCPDCGAHRALETQEIVVTKQQLPKENEKIVQVHAVPFQDVTGQWFVANYTADITDVKRVEQNLREFKTAVEQSADGICLADMDGRVRFANNAWAEMHGYSVDEIIDRHLSIFHTQEQMEEEVTPFLERLMAYRSSGGEIEHRQKGYVWHARKHGSTFPTQMTTTLLKGDDGKPFGMLGIARDMTEEVHQRERERFDLEFRRLIAEASTRLVQVDDNDSFDQAVDGMLAALGKFFGVERSYLFRFSEDLTTMDNTHEWCATGITAHKDRCRQLSTDAMPWWKARMLELHPVQVPEMAVLPAEAAAEREEFRSQGIQSLICLPICDEHKRLLGFVGLDAVRAPRHWPDEQVGMLHVLAEILGSTIVRMEVVRVLAENKRQLDVFFSQSLTGFFFMMLDEPVAWNDATDKEELLDYVMAHQRVTKANQALLDQYGAEEQDFLGLTPGDLFAHDLDHARYIWRGLFDRGRWHVQTRERRLDGTPIIIDGDYICLYDEQGRITGFFGTQTDITERRRSEEALRDNEARLRAITDSAQDAIIMLDPRGRISFWNPAAETILGYRLEEAMGQDLHELLVPERFLEAYRAAMPEFQRTGRGKVVGNTVELAARCKNGREITIALSLSAVFLDGQWHAVGILRDITERKRAQEQLLEANRQLEAATARANEMAAQAESATIAKSEFLANMSHEIRTPLNGVIGMTGLLLDTELSEEQQHYAAIVRSSGESLLGIINDILDFSKIEAGKLDLEILTFDLQSLLDDFAASMALHAYEKGLELICAADADVPWALSGDPGRLRQVLNNLAGNALKFTHQGEVSVRVSLEEKTQGGGRDGNVVLRFSVRDTGIGIPKEKMGLLFSKFTQVDVSDTKPYGGTGLGLAISKQLVEMMGGTLGVRSVEGTGTEFWFTASFGWRPDAAREEMPLPASLDGVRVLIVDDNATNREILTTRLTSWGMRPEQVSNGAAGLQALYRALDEGDGFRLAIIDMQMPSMNGEALGCIVRADARLDATRLVMLGSLGVRHNAHRLYEIGFSACAVKPVRHQELKAMLCQILSGDARPAVGTQPIAAYRTACLPGPSTRTGERLPRFAGSRARILVAEDNAVNQAVALGILKKLGLTADAVANGREVVETLKMLPYDLVLMDVQMPEMNGLEAARQIRDPQSPVRDRHIPIIALTAAAMEGDRERCLAAGMNGYLTKPVSLEAVVEALNAWLPPKGKRCTATPFTGPREWDRADTDLPVFDRAGMMARLMDEELAEVILTGFLESAPHQLGALWSSLNAENTADVEREAHRLKGAAANVGGERVRLRAFLLEQAARAGDLIGSTKHLTELETQFNRFRKAVMEHHGRLDEVCRE